MLNWLRQLTKTDPKALPETWAVWEPLIEAVRQAGYLRLSDASETA